MSNLSRLFGLAKNALEKSGGLGSSGTGSGSGNRSGSGTGGGSSSNAGGDWRSIVRSAADALTGDSRQQSRDQWPNSGTGRDARGSNVPHSSAGAGTYPAYGARDAGSASAGTGATITDRAASASAPELSAEDRAAIARYDYLLQTAEPQQIEQVHREAFARLTPAQREAIEQRMRSELPAHEQPRSSSPDDLARTATRAEMSRPGLLKGLLARVPAFGRSGGSGAGASGARGGGAVRGLGAAAAGLGGGAIAGAGLMAGGALAAVAGGAVLSSVAGPLLEQATNLGVDFESLAAGLDPEALLGGVDGLAGVDDLAAGAGDLAAGAGDAVAGVSDQVGGLGDQVTGLGDQLSEFGSNFTLPGLDDLFGR